MKYTNETLHGLIYQHKNGGPIYRIIEVSPYMNSKFTHITCNVKTGITVDPWINLEIANRWIENGMWILQEKPSLIINNYEIY